jgi:signal transduction histidine kinase
VSSPDRWRRLPLARRIFIVISVGALLEAVVFLVAMHAVLAEEQRIVGIMEANDDSRAGILSLALGIQSVHHRLGSLPQERSGHTVSELRQEVLDLSESAATCAQGTCHVPTGSTSRMVESTQAVLDGVLETIGLLAVIDPDTPEYRRWVDESDEQIDQLFLSLQRMSDLLDEDERALRADLTEASRRTLGIIYLMMAALLMVVVGGSALLARHIAAPLRPLLRATRRVSAGDFAFTLDEGSEDEFGELAAAFNQMATRLRKAIARQRAYAMGLESEMDRRTAELLRREASSGGESEGQILERFAERGLGELTEALDAVADGISSLGEPSGAGAAAAIDIDATLAPLRRCQRTLSTLRELTSPAAEELGRVAVGPVVASFAEAESEGLRARGVALAVRLPAEPLVTPGAAEHLLPVLHGLVDNGVEAMDGPGSIEIVVARSGDECSVRVSDSGAGVAPEARDRFFEAFFTTKVDHGGLGLSLARVLVRRLGGRLRVHHDRGLRADGGGTTFEVLLPILHEVDQRPVATDSASGSALRPSSP